jgi:hypothetical protein
MKYMMLLHNDESAWQTMPEDARTEAIAAYMEYNGALAAAGVLAGGGQLQPSHTATTLRGTDGQVEITDGPFAETREQVGGFYILEVPDLDAALAWAKRCPAVHGGAIEIRPLGTVPDELDGSPA